MEEWSESVKLAVDVFVACIIVVAMIVVTSLVKDITHTVDKNRSLNADIAEFRIQQTYQDTTCYAQDIVSVVLEYQGTPAVVVTTLSGTNRTWSSESYYTPLTASAISGALNQSSLYDCTLAYDANGVVSAFNFKEVTAP